MTMSGFEEGVTIVLPRHMLTLLLSVANDDVIQYAGLKDPTEEEQKRQAAVALWARGLSDAAAKLEETKK